MQLQKQASHRLAATDLNIIDGWVGATRWVTRSMTYLQLLLSLALKFAAIALSGGKGWNLLRALNYN